MIKEQTVLVLGAGASYDLGFPLGERLWHDIYSFILKKSYGINFQNHEVIIENYKLLANLLKEAVGLGLENDQDKTNEKFVKEFANELFNAQPKSIDQFLNDRSEFSLLGRICIIFCISRYEDKRSENFFPFYSQQAKSYAFPDFGWYKYLWDKMTENIDSIEEFKKKNKITVITFNYDRSLEFYLFRALKAKFNKHDADTANIFKEIKIKHVYGRLAPFYWEQNYLNPSSDLSEEDLAMECNNFIPWESSVLFRIWGDVGTHGVNERDFEPNKSNRPILTLESIASRRSVFTEEDRSQLVRRFIYAANNIKIYSEVIDAHKSREYLSDFNNAKRIYFLGFGYHEQNLLALGMTDTDRVLNKGAKIFGTAYGMSDGEMETKRRRLCRNKGVPYANRQFAGVNLNNNWSNMNSKDSIIKDFFRKVPEADLV